MKDESLDTTLAEHHDCMRVVSEVEACLDTPPDRQGEWLTRLRDKLPQLAESLRSHFASEEQGALYREVPLRYPRFAKRLDDLAAEHGQILESAADVIQRAGAIGPSRIYELRELNARTQLLVATIRRHEAEENEIILSAHWDEMGAGD